MKFIHRRLHLPIDEDYFLSLLSGSEAGVATTAALIIGLESSGQTVGIISTAALIAILVEAFNTSAIRYSEETTQNEIEDTETEEKSQPVVAATLQFLLHILFGGLLLAPVWVLPGIFQLESIFITGLLLLFIIGLIKGHFVPRNTILHALQIVFVGLLVMIVGLLTGIVLS